MHYEQEVPHSDIKMPPSTTIPSFIVENGHTNLRAVRVAQDPAGRAPFVIWLFDNLCRHTPRPVDGVHGPVHRPSSTRAPMQVSLREKRPAAKEGRVSVDDGDRQTRAVVRVP